MCAAPRNTTGCPAVHVVQVLYLEGVNPHGAEKLLSLLIVSIEIDWLMWEMTTKERIEIRNINKQRTLACAYDITLLFGKDTQVHRTYAYILLKCR